MNRLDTIIDLDEAIAKIERVQEQLLFMVCTESMTNRLDTLLNKLEDLRVDILQADLPGEQD